MSDNFKTVYVVQYLELGWDNVIGVFDADKVDLVDLDKIYPDEDKYIITERILATTIE